MTDGDDNALQRSAGKPGRSGAETTRLAVALVAGGLISVFALLNTGQVEVNWIIGTVETPLIIVIVVSLAVGGALGYAFARRGAKRKRSRG
jgi:uncharacterized integral membrane protein